MEDCCGFVRHVRRARTVSYADDNGLDQVAKPEPQRDAFDVRLAA
jgi:hypothetical protein